MTIMVSACLVGVGCRYDCKDKYDNRVLEELSDNPDAWIFCPEYLGGLPTPREPAHIEGGDGNDVLKNNAKVISNDSGEDLTKHFIVGASNVQTICKTIGITKALVKAGSPSCGFTKLGVTTAALIEIGIEVEEY